MLITEQRTQETNKNLSIAGGRTDTALYKLGCMWKSGGEWSLGLGEHILHVAWRIFSTPLVPGLTRRPTDQILEVSLFVARGQIGLKRLDTGFIIFHKADLSASVAEWVVLINILRIKEISFYTESHHCRQQYSTPTILQGVFLTGAPLKVLSVRLHSKSHQKVLSVRIYLPKKTCDF